ncbi:MAG TPA: Sec-independent protein translocase protein TatB [Methyloceanibacter sp.]|nr:Sec-independent protein translocase protein TatB [Methyloceanibacter sp.]
MLDIGWSELLVVAVVAIVVVGPKDLPKLMRTFGFYAGKIRRAAGDFQRQFEDAMAESEADEVRKNIEAIRANMGTTDDFKAPADRPLMRPAAEPARTALGAPPLGTQPARETTKRKAAPAKNAVKKATKKAAKPSTSTASRNTKAKAKTKTPRKTPARAKARAKTRRKR